MDRLLRRGADWVIILVLVAIAAIVLFASVAKAQQPGSGILCNTQMEIESLAALAETGSTPVEAIEAVNTNAGTVTCGVIHFLASEIEVVHRMTVKGHDMVILKLMILAVMTPQGPIPAGVVQYTMAAAQGFVPARLGI